jgi:ribokinase
MASPLVVVVGSVNMDLVVRTPGMPVPGQTVMGSDLATHPGGKGANQAVAAARLGATTHLVARVGADDFGSRLISALEGSGVATTFVTVTDSAATGTASILVDEESGDNAIVVSPGANAKLTPEDVDRAAPLIRTASAVLLQLEVPLETIAHTIQICHKHRVQVILDPAPPPVTGQLPGELYGVSVFTPNQTEAALLLGLSDPRSPKTARAALPEPKQIAASLLSRGPAGVVLKLGEQGALYASPDGTVLHVPAFKVKVKDTTAAGDAFTAGLAIARAEGMPPAEALRFANAAGAIACMNEGAQPSLPKRGDVEEMMRRWA